MQVSLIKQPGMVQVSNTNFANRCTICGGGFEVDSSICPNGHYFGQIYYIDPKDLPKIEKVEKKELEKGAVICQAFGSRCNICGSFIPEGDDICNNAHQIGKLYLIK
ncbi:MAG: hypothetical protein WCZ12_02775 [Patescibacteria group bacterium]